MKTRFFLYVFIVVIAAIWAQPAFSAAIWTSLDDGSEVNFNIYAAKEDVYLNGGPGKGAGSNAPGLADGIYVFMVTDPSAKNLLSTDNAECRQVVVDGGVIDGAFVVPSGCQHIEGAAAAGTPVQLFPYGDTPNNGGEYKAWLTPLASYTCPLNVVSCPSDTFGFVNSESKTDNFKVGDRTADEIDTRFYDENGNIMDSLRIKWIDTHGANNRKWSYYAPKLSVFHEAHVEAPEPGVHKIQIDNQPGCEVHEVWVDGVNTNQQGPQTVEIRFTNGMKKKQTTIFVDVDCHTQ